MQRSSTSTTEYRKLGLELGNNNNQHSLLLNYVSNLNYLNKLPDNSLFKGIFRALFIMIAKDRTQIIPESSFLFFLKN